MTPRGPRALAEQYAREIMVDYAIHDPVHLDSGTCGKAEAIEEDLVERFLSFLGSFREEG